MRRACTFAVLAAALAACWGSGAAAAAPTPAGAAESRIHTASLGAGVDALTHDATQLGTLGFRGTVSNWDATASLTHVAITADSSLAFDPPVSFPHTESTASLGPQASFDMDAIAAQGPGTSQISGVAFATGYDLSRSVSPSAVPAGGGDVTVTVTVTLVDPSLAQQGGVGMRVESDLHGTLSGTSIVSQTPPLLQNGEVAEPNGSNGTVAEFRFHNAVLTSYVYQVVVHIPNATGAPVPYEPYVQVYAAGSQNLADTTSTSVSIDDATVLQGSFAFSADQAVQWFPTVSDVYTTGMDGEWAVPHADAQDTRIDFMSVDAGTDVVAAGSTATGWRGWRGTIFNGGDAALPSPSISVDGSSQTFTPPVTFPVSSSGASVAPHSTFELHAIDANPPPSARVDGVAVTTRYDASRSVSGTVPPGGGDVTVTVTVTLRDPAEDHGSVQIQLYAQQYTGAGGATFVAGSEVAPTTGEGEVVDNDSLDATTASWSIHDAKVEKPYTYSVQVSVPNPGTSAIVYKPQVVTHDGYNVFADAQDGAQATLHDAGLGGTFTYSLGESVHWSLQQSYVTGVNFQGVWPPAAAGTLGGTVTDGSSPVAGVLLQACDSTGCTTTTSDAAGAYSFAVSGGVLVTVSPPAPYAPQGFLVTVPSSGSATRDVLLQVPLPLPAGTTITSSGSAGGVPVVLSNQTLALSTTGCAGGSGTYTVADATGATIRGPLPLAEGPAGTYTATVDPLLGAASPVRFTLSIDCGTTIETTAFDAYVDPSGHVLTTTGIALAGATVTLLRADTEAGPFTEVPNGDLLMSPLDRRNPDRTDASGHFGWDVLAGVYEVRAEYAGCTSATTGPLTVPPPALGLELRLQCSPATSIAALVESIVRGARHPAPLVALLRDLDGARGKSACPRLDDAVRLIRHDVDRADVPAEVAAPWLAEAARLRTQLHC